MSHTIVRNQVRVLSSPDGQRGQINLGTGFIQRDLIDLGYTHVRVTRIEASNSLLSLYPLKSAGDDGKATPLQVKRHGGTIVELPWSVQGWLGSDWTHYFKGRGWVTVDVRRGEVDKGYSMRLLLPSNDQLMQARLKLAQLPTYPEFD
jgi:hypothetical protein